MPSSKETLHQFGFTDSEADIYLALNTRGEMDVPSLAKELGLSRTAIYDVLNTLLAKGYIDYRKQGRNAYYKAGHPNKLAGLLEEKKRETALLAGDMAETIRQLTGSFNLAQNKPGVRFFEGEDGIHDVLDYIANGFKPNTELLSFVKVKPPQYEKQLNSAVDAFIKKRIAAGVKTLVLAIDNEEGKKLKQNDKDALRETRLVPEHDLSPGFFGGEIFMYNNDVCMATVEEERFFALAISSPAIANMFKSIFFSQWVLLS